MKRSHMSLHSNKLDLYWGFPQRSSTAERTLTDCIDDKGDNFILSFISISIIFLILVLFLSVFSFAKIIQLLNDDFARLANIT